MVETFASVKLSELTAMLDHLQHYYRDGILVSLLLHAKKDPEKKPDLEKENGCSEFSTSTNQILARVKISIATIL